MTPSVRKTIRHLYEHDDESVVLGVLTRIGQGIVHARSAILYDALLRMASGDKRALAALVDWAIASPNEFDQYLFRWKSWNWIAQRFSSGSPTECYAFMAPIVTRVAPLAAEYRCSVHTSHDTLCVHDSNEEFPQEIGLYITPIINGGVYISDDDESLLAPKTPSIAEFCDGELASASASSDRIIYNMDKMFCRDCHPNLAR